MPRTKIEDPDLLPGNKSIEETTEANTETSREATVQTKAKKQNCVVVESVDCYIGNRHIQLEKNTTVALDPDVAAILSNAGKIYRL